MNSNKCMTKVMILQVFFTVSIFATSDHSSHGLSIPTYPACCHETKSFRHMCMFTFVYSQGVTLRDVAHRGSCNWHQRRAVVIGHRSLRMPLLRCADSSGLDGEPRETSKGKEKGADLPVVGGGFEEQKRTVEQVEEGEQKKLMKSLQQRKKQVDEGAGRVYLVCTQAGFLNVHKDPDDPYRLDNVVSQIFEGDIVESVGPDDGDWVQHDMGGWSVREFGGFTWLKPLDESRLE